MDTWSLNIDRARGQLSADRLRYIYVRYRRSDVVELKIYTKTWQVYHINHPASCLRDNFASRYTPYVLLVLRQSVCTLRVALVLFVRSYNVRQT